MVSQTPLFSLFSLPLPPARVSLRLLSFLPCCQASVLPAAGFVLGTAAGATSPRLSVDTAHLRRQRGLPSFSPCRWLQTQRKLPRRMFVLPGLTPVAAFCSPCLSEVVSVVARPPLPSQVLRGAVPLQPVSLVTGAWCSPWPPHATGHFSHSSLSLVRTRLPHQPGHCLGTRLCPNVAALETGTLSPSGAQWHFRFPILFRASYLYYPPHNILFCCIPQHAWLCTASDVSCIRFLPSVGAHPPFRGACGLICSQDGGWMERETSASLPLSWDWSLQLLPAAGRTGNTLSPRAVAHQIYCGEDGGEQEGCGSRLRQSQQNVSSPFCQGASFIVVALCRWGGLPSVLGRVWQPTSITISHLKGHLFFL